MSLSRSPSHRPFAFHWSGQTISRLGDRFYNIALAWWVLEKTGSAVAMGIMLIFSSVPMLIFLLIGGIAVDRYSRGRLMLASTVQELVPRELLGRVSSIDYLGSFALLPIGYGIAGWATDLIGARSVLILGGTLTAMVAALGMLHPEIRGLD